MVCGKYKLDQSSNFDEFLQALGVGLLMRKMAATSKPVVEIKKDDDVWKIITSTTFKTSEIKFKLGEEFEETRMDGSLVKTVVTLEDEKKLIQKQFGDKEVVIVRELNDDGDMTVTCTVDDVVSVRVYKKV